MKSSLLFLPLMVFIGLLNTIQDAGAWSFLGASTNSALSASTNVVLGASQKPEALKIDFVEVKDPNNLPDRNGYGAVAESFKIGKYDITVAQYCKFLNAVASKEDTYGLYDEKMSSDLDVASVERRGTPGNYSYIPKPGAEQFPIVYVNWFCAARFCNWMHNGQPIGPQGVTTTEAGAYTLNGATKDLDGDVTTAPSDYCKLNEGAKFFIPTENQYYKAAYFKRISGSPEYWNYATMNDFPPGNGAEPDSGIHGKNKANYFIKDNSQYNRNQLVGFAWNAKKVIFNAQYTNGGKQPFLTPVGHFVNTLSPYGTFDMAGNVSQWLSNTAGTASATRPIRGGCWGPPPYNSEDQQTYNTLAKVGQLFKFFRTDGKGQCMKGEIQLNKENSMVIDATVRRDYIGFRIASPM